MAAAKKKTKKSSKKTSTPKAKQRAEAKSPPVRSAAGALRAIHEKSAPDPKGWDERDRREREEKSYGLTSMPFAFYMKNDGDSAVIAFLNEGTALMMHNLAPPKAAPQYVLCKEVEGGECPLCAAGHKPVQRTVYMVLHIDNHYQDKETGKTIHRPQIKIFNRGRNDVKAYEKAKARQGKGFLSGKVWEMTRDGTGTDTVYEIELQPKQKVDLVKLFAEKGEVRTKEGIKRLPLIRQPEWPKPIKGSLLEQDAWKPKKDMNWADPKNVNLWIIAVFANSPPSVYERFADQAATSESEIEEEEDPGISF